MENLYFLNMGLKGFTAGECCFLRYIISWEILESGERYTKNFGV